MADRLEAAEIDKKIQTVPQWTKTGEKIERTIEFDGFMDAVDFINRIAPLADRADHHPEIFNVYNRVELALTTHDAGGLTEKDFRLAKEIDKVVQG